MLDFDSLPGQTDGLNDGETDGDALGDFDGDTEADGLNDGETDGDTEADGLTEGDTDGEADGLILGETDGESAISSSYVIINKLALLFLIAPADTINASGGHAYYLVLKTFGKNNVATQKL